MNRKGTKKIFNKDFFFTFLFWELDERNPASLVNTTSLVSGIAISPIKRQG